MSYFEGLKNRLKGLTLEEVEIISSSRKYKARDITAELHSYNHMSFSINFKDVRINLTDSEAYEIYDMIQKPIIEANKVKRRKREEAEKVILDELLEE